MKWLDKQLARWFPEHTLKGLRAKAAVKAFYEAARTSRLHKQNKAAGSPDAENRSAATNLLMQARHLEQNYDVAKGALDVLVANVVGMGIMPTPQVKNLDGTLAEDVNRQLKRLFKDWARFPEVTHEHSLGSLQRLMARSLYRDGEVLAQRVMGKSKSLDHGTKVPYSLEPMEADYLPMVHDDTRSGVVQGVQKNAWGRPLAYFVFKDHPGDSYASNTAAFGDLKRIPADRILHLKITARFKQTRGISIFAVVMNRIDDIKEIEESERVAARMAAAMAAYIKKGSPDLYVAPDSGETNREIDFVPGMTFDGLQPGEEVGMISSDRPNNALIPFIKSNGRAMAAGLGTSYSSVAKDYDGTYSSQRQELVESRMHYGVLWQDFVEKFCQPVYEDFILAATTERGLIDGLEGIDPDTLYDVTHSRPPMPWIDPGKEMDGIEKELTLGVTSLDNVIRRRGDDPEEVALQVEIERRQKAELDQELAPKVNPAQNTPQPDEGDPDADPQPQED